MARRTSWSLGGSSQIGGGYPSRIGGMIGARPSFLWLYFASIRSAVHGWTGMGVNSPNPNGWHPTETPVKAATARSNRWRRIRDMLPSVRAGSSFIDHSIGCDEWESLVPGSKFRVEDRLGTEPGTGNREVETMVFLSRIYTKSGDGGDTGLGDGTRVPKDHVRIEAIGEVDELNAVLGLVVASCPGCPEVALIRGIQNDLFDVGADLCTPLAEGEPEGKALRVTASQAEQLEKAIDRLNEPLQPLRSFILPGGTPAAAHLHHARTVCRRAERA